MSALDEYGGRVVRSSTRGGIGEKVMAVAGVGVDIFEIARMERALARTPGIAKRLFTDEERAYCQAKARPAQHFACRFAAKEAILKALGTGFSQGISAQDISVSHDSYGKPLALLQRKAAQIAQEQGVLEIALSLSFTHEVAIANAVAVTEQVRPKLDEKSDQKAELAASFREARSVLDELEHMQIENVSSCKSTYNTNNNAARSDNDNISRKE